MVGETIREIRKRFGWSQRATAKSLGITDVHLNNIEHGRSKPSSALLEEVRKTFYGIDPYVYAWCKYGDVSKLPATIQNAAEILRHSWEIHIEETLESDITP